MADGQHRLARPDRRDYAFGLLDEKGEAVAPLSLGILTPDAAMLVSATAALSGAARGPPVLSRRRSGEGCDLEPEPPSGRAPRMPVQLWNVEHELRIWS